MITKQLLRDWSACWTDERIAEYFGRRKELTPREIAADESISLDDRLWVMCRTLWYLDESAALGFAIESASLVTHLAGDEDDQAAHAGILAWLLEIEDLPADQRASARASAWASAWDSARDSARASARASAWDSARDSARASAWASAWASARASARASAWDSEIRKAITRALEWLGDYADGWEEP